MNFKIYAIALMGALSLVVVSCAPTKNEIEAKEYRNINRFYVREVPKKERDAMRKFRELVVRRRPDIYNADDVFFDIPDLNLWRAISEFLQDVSGPYQAEDEQQYVEDFNKELLTPCKNLYEIWTTGPAYYIKQTYEHNDEFIRLVKSSARTFESLETATICRKLVGEAQVAVKKSFDYTLKHKPRNKTPKPVQNELEVDEDVEDEQVGGLSEDVKVEEEPKGGEAMEVADGVGAEDKVNDVHGNKSADEIMHEAAESAA